MTPATKAAMAAIEQVMVDDPDGFAEAMLESLPQVAVESLMSAFLKTAAIGWKKSHQATGYLEALIDITGKAQRICNGYREIGEEAVSWAFHKFAGKLTELATVRAAELKADTERRVAELRGRTN